MNRRLRAFLSRLSLPAPPPQRIVREEDLAGLPEPAQRYLRFMGIVGKPMTWSFEAAFSGRFRVDVARPWAPARAVQYNLIRPSMRVFLLNLRVAGLPVRAVDSYVNGQGRMRGRLLGLKTIVDDSAPETTTGELSTYLSELVLLLPSALLEHDITWNDRDDSSFDVTLRDHGLSVSGTMVLDERGACKEFSTTDRFYAPGPGQALRRTRWTLTGGDVREVAGRKVDLKARAVWHPPEGNEPYADFTLDRIEWNVAPV